MIEDIKLMFIFLNDQARVDSLSLSDMDSAKMAFYNSMKLKRCNPECENFNGCLVVADRRNLICLNIIIKGCDPYLEIMLHNQRHR